MYGIDPDRSDLSEEFNANPGGPHSDDLAKAIKRLRTGPFEERYLIVCTKRGREWTVGRWPTERGKPIELPEDGAFSDYADAVRMVFGLRWKAATDRDAGHGIYCGEEIAAPFAGDYPGRTQEMPAGSYVSVPNHEKLVAPGQEQDWNYAPQEYGAMNGRTITR